MSYAERIRETQRLNPPSWRSGTAVEIAAEADATIAQLLDALASIEQYGSDTLSGKAGGYANDAERAEWIREGVREMRNRARSAISAAKGEA